MRPTRAIISGSALRFNLDGIRAKVGPGVKIMGVVKANAYGHGMEEIADLMVLWGVDYLGVGFLEEGIALRNHGISLPILVLGGVLGNQVRDFLKYNLDITVSSLEIGKSIDHQAALFGAGKANVHLKIDTGMERIGVRAENAGPFLDRIFQLPHLNVAGVYSHFATSDEKEKAFALEQLQRFERVLAYAEAKHYPVPLAHMANSGAVLDLPQSYFTMVRPGVMTYGAYPSQETSESIPLRPVMSLESKVVFLKDVEAGIGVSYGLRYTTPGKTRIATVPIGYGDGYSRRLTNQADVLIGGRRYPVVGTVCMDQLMVDLGPDSPVRVGDNVVLMGRDGDESITAWELAGTLGTIPYEVFTGIAARVPRIIQ
jgi:alanine racemase